MKKTNGFILLLALSAMSVFAGPQVYKERTSGIVFRGSYWGSENKETGVQVTSQGMDNTVSVSGYGGWIEFFSRMNDQLYITWALGSSADVNVSEKFLSQNEVDSKSITPLVMGLQYHLIPTQRESVLQPYVSAGIGPYWEHEAQSDSRFWGYQDTRVKSKMQFGMNFGGGAFFRVSNSFALNFDMKYHLVDFDSDHDFSGFEVGFGCGFFWGQY